MHFPKICALNLLVSLPLLACTADKDDTDTNATPATATDATSSAGTGTSTGGTAADTTSDAETTTTTTTAPTTGSDTTEGAMTATSDMTGATSDMTGATSDMTGATSDMTSSTTSDDTTGDDTTGADTSTGEPAGLSYALDVHPVVIAGTCGCHANGVGGLKFADAATAYAAWVNVQSNGSSLDRIEPGDPDKSYVLQKFLGNQINVGSGQNMPLGGPALSQEKLDLFEQWILDGAAP